MLSDMYFGVTDRQGGHFRIRPLSILTREAGRWVRSASVASHSILGDTGLVFYHDDLRLRNAFHGQPVRFQVSSGRRIQGHDAYQVTFQPGTHQRAIWEHGAEILKAASVTGRWRDGVRPEVHRPDGLLVWIDEGGSVYGPWQVVAGRLHPLHTGRIGRLSIADLLGHFDTWDETRSSRQYLASDLEPTEWLDASSRDELADWLFDQLELWHRPVLQELEQARPGWRSSLRQQFHAMTRQEDPAPHAARWTRAEAILQELNDNEDLTSRILASTLFQTRLNEALAVEVHRRAEAIEAAAQAEAAARNQVLQDLDQRITERHLELAKLEGDILEREKALEQERDRLGQTAQSVRDAREYLSGELSGLASLLQQTILPAVPLASPPVAPPPAVAVPPVPRLTGPALLQHSEFVDRRLHPLLAAREPGCRRSHADRLHATLLACPWVLVPSPRWAEAYEEALGGSGRRLVLPVQATWAGFDDVWSAELESFWRQAAADLSRIHLVVFHEMNRSLVPVWASAWHTVMDGHRPTLPADPPVHWPVNLRVLATVARDDAVLPLDNGLLERWAAPVDLDLSGGRNDPPPGPAGEGHVPAATWLGWAGRPIDQPLDPGRAVAHGQLIRLLGDADDPLLENRRQQIFEFYPRSYLGGAARERS